MRGRWAAIAVVLAAAAAACGLGEPADVMTDVTSRPPAVSYVAIGGDESVEEAPESRRDEVWPRAVFRQHLPPQALFTDLARRGATADDAVRDQLPEALTLQPTLATVWLVSGDVEARTSSAAYAAALDELVSRLDAAGAQTVVLTDPNALPGYVDAAEAAVVGRDAVALRVPPGATQGDIADLVAAALVVPAT